MNIHIRRPVEFEKCLDHTFRKSIDLTRTRMTIQQLLDSHADEDFLVKSLESYCTQYLKTLQAIKNTTILQQQPVFSWSVDGENIQTPCWLFEGIVPHIALYNLYVNQAITKANSGDFKTANKIFKNAERKCEQSCELAAKWKWKVPSMNHSVVRERWHIAQKYTAQTYQHLCYIGVALENDSNSKTLLTFSERAFSTASKAYANWKENNSGQLIKIADGLRHLFDSHVKWEDGAYGSSIYILESYFSEPMPDTFKRLNEEFEKIPFLLQERLSTNNQAYFDTVKPHETQSTTEEIIKCA